MNAVHDLDQPRLSAAIHSVFDVRQLGVTIAFDGLNAVVIHAVLAGGEHRHGTFECSNYADQAQLTIAILAELGKPDLSEEQLIIDNAPSEDWEAYYDGDYYKQGVDSAHMWVCGNWYYQPDQLGCKGRNRKDIELIAELKA